VFGLRAGSVCREEWVGGGGGVRGGWAVGEGCFFVKGGWDRVFGFFQQIRR